MKHKVPESEERVQGGLLLPLLPTLNSVKPGGGDQDRVILALTEVETEIPRRGELALPVTHGGAVEGEGVDVPDVGLGGPLLVQPGDGDGDGMVVVEVMVMVMVVVEVVMGLVRLAMVMAGTT